MSKSILVALNAHEPAAFANAKKWMTCCKYDTPEVWVAYSKLIEAYLTELTHYSHNSHADDNAWPIVRYYALALNMLQNKPWNANSFLQLHNTVELWSQIPEDVWIALHSQRWNPSALYKWSIATEKMQQTALNTRPAGKYHAEPLHIRMGAGILEQCFRGLPLLLDAEFHWTLWDVFYGEQVFQTSPDLPRRIDLLSKATPASFEHAITEFYQRSEGMVNQTSCASLLQMDMRLGHPLTTCSGALLLYFRFQHKNRHTFDSIENRYPLLLKGFDIHLNLYPDVNDALQHAPALMGHWQRAIHGDMPDEPLTLPSNLESVL